MATIQDSKAFSFCKTDKAQAASMAAFVAELVRQGVTYDVKNGVECITITLTGGY